VNPNVQPVQAMIENQKPSHMVDIITDKDTFRAIMENQYLIPT
jgi:hypothetical protein